jgi:hypothetical protein
MFGELNEKQAEYLKDIYASGTHLLSLINDILDLSKIEAGRMELELTDFDLPTAVDNAPMLVRERAGRRSITLHSAVDSQLGQIRADERKIRQVLLNLLSNAIKFTPQGGRIEYRPQSVRLGMDLELRELRSDAGSAAALLRLARRAPTVGSSRTCRCCHSTFHLLGVPRRDLVVSHWHRDDRPGHPLSCDENPRAAVAPRVEPCPIVKRVVLAAIDEEIEVHAGDVGDGTVGYDDDGWRRGQYNSRRRR